MPGRYLQTRARIAMARVFGLIYQICQYWHVWHILIFNMLQAHTKIRVVQFC